MDGSSHLRPAVAAAGLGIVVAFSIPGLRALVSRRGTPPERTGSPETGGQGYLYEDADGKATEQSMRAYSDWRPRVAAWASAAVGQGTSVAAAILLLANSSNDVSSSRLTSLVTFDIVSDIVAWALICLQCASIPTKHQYGRRYRISVCGLLSSVTLFASLVTRFGAVIIHIGAKNRSSGVVLALGLCWFTQMLAATTSSVSFALFPQRPDVYIHGRLVDQLHGASLLRRLTYSWNRVVFNVSRQRQLEASDLPELDDMRRSSAIHTRFSSWRRREGRPLWRQLVEFHAWKLAQQWALAFANSVFALFPQYVLYNFLEILDRSRRSPSSPGVDYALLAWVFSLFASLMLQNWANHFMRWLTSSRLEEPVLSLLEAMVFQKAMRLRETASPPSKTDGDGSDSKDGTDAQPADVAKAGGTDARQSIVNHLKLDTNRMVMFSSYSYYFPVAFFKLALAGGFLMQLVGWKAVTAGLSSAIFVLPVSQWLSKKYGKIQFGLMKFRDGKAHLLTEALQGMRQIKFSALEQHWEDKILASREEELAQFWKVTLWTSLISLILNLFPMVLASVTLSVYAFTTQDGIRASVIFASIGLLDQLDDAIGWLPILQVYLMESWTSCVRLEKFFDQPEKEPIATPGDHVALENATVAWPKFEEVAESPDTAEPLDPRSLLRDVTLDFPNSELSIVTGKTGSGKSLLLAAILGEVMLVSGRIRMPPAPDAPAGLAFIPEEDWILPSLTAFVSQTPWIETGTVRENILFGLPLNTRRYSKVLAACALEKDIELLIDGDNTEVGPKGVSLSGGQRWRVALARALYSRAGILILDDVLSAVDAHVGRIIVDHALTGELARGRTRILATHHAEMCLPRASYVVRLLDGRLESAEALVPKEECPSPDRLDDGSSTAGLSSEEATVADTEEQNRGYLTPLSSPDESDSEEDGKRAQKRKSAKDREKEREETRETGRVKWSVYRAYMAAGNAALLWLLAIMLIISTRFILVGRTWTLKEVSESDPPESVFAGSNSFGHGYGGGYGSLNSNSDMGGGFDSDFDNGVGAGPNMHGYAAHLSYTQNPLIYTHQQLGGQQLGPQMMVSREQSVAFWMAAYIVLGIVSVAVGIGRQLIFTSIGLRTAKVLFERMTFAILRAPLRWIDTTPSGRILNRFTSDVFTVDRRVAAELGGSLQSVLAVVTIVLASLSVSKWVNVFGLALLVLYARVASEYIGAARDIKRINSVVWSPIYDQFSSVLTGLSTIRGFGRADFYSDRMYQLIDTATKTSWALTLCHRWMSFRMGAIGVLFVSLVAVAVAISRVDAALAGFGLTFALQYTGALTNLLQNMASIELGFNATERVLEYCDLETEPQGGEDAPAAWPTRGEIEVENLTVAYGDGMPAVLKNLNFTVRPGERVGIVGRTGAGKSTLASILFRLLEPREGCVRIDGIDIARLKLSQLRSRLAIIPQDPFLFSGTLRSNLDMESELDDFQLQHALQRVQLVRSEPEPGANSPAAPDQNGDGDVVDKRDAFSDLSTPISTGGTNLSQGQRQLICLARALLARPKIVVLDEATSAVDQTTDAAIQESLREEFVATGCTVFVIAHRLSTVADFDKVLVLREGRVAEMGTPAELLRRGMAADEERKSKKGREEEAEADVATDDDDRGSTGTVGAPAEEYSDESASSQDPDDVGAFWDLVQRSAEKDKLIEIILGKTDG